LTEPLYKDGWKLNKWESARDFDYMIAERTLSMGDIEYLKGKIAQRNVVGIRINIRKATFTCVLVKEGVTTQVPRVYTVT
jgi:hypothetical protein